MTQLRRGEKSSSPPPPGGRDCALATAHGRLPRHGLAGDVDLIASIAGNRIMNAPLAYRPYVARDMRPEQPMRFGRWHFKMYGIEEMPIRGFDSEMLAAVRRVIETNLPRLEKTQHHFAGFVLLHRDSEDVWLLVNWWTHSSIISELLFHADLADETSFREVNERSVACIWEMVPMMFERDAWVAHALALDGSVAKYLEQSMAEGCY